MHVCADPICYHYHGLYNGLFTNMTSGFKIESKLPPFVHAKIPGSQIIHQDSVTPFGSE